MSPVHPDILSALTAGIQSEVASYVFYIEAGKKHETGQIRDILMRLAGEEKQHFQILERQYDSLVRSEKWISTADVLKQPGLPDISEEMTATHRALIDEVARSRSLSAILDIAYRLELEARDLFRSSARGCPSEDGKKIFNQLAKFEEGHMKLVSYMRRQHA
ncbi:MAG TPA: ferritin family protein [Candidatus Deferrimicrobium sp.]|nr:ferritin family protein [Candidatus Deferrimicrobium sp.]